LKVQKKSGETLDCLFEVIESRKGTSPDSSYTAQLFNAGTPQIAKKIGEESVETIVAAFDDPKNVASESADLIYHLLVLWSAVGVKPADVWAELNKRRGVSGLNEKGSR